MSTPSHLQNRADRQTPWWKRLLEIIGSISVIIIIWIALTAMLDKVVMPLVTAHSREREIPDLFELTYDEARRMAKKNKFQIEKSETRFDSFYPPGVVIEQVPPPFTLSKIGRKIKVVVSGGEQKLPVPQVTGIPLKEALFKLDEQGFSVPQDSVKLIFSEYYPDGVVVEQPFTEGTMLNRGASFGLTVSMGPLPKRFVVPELYTLNLRQATEKITRAGLTLGRIESVRHAHADSGMVVDQSIPPHTKVDYLQPVNLKISIGAKPSP